MRFYELFRTSTVRKGTALRFSSEKIEKESTWFVEIESTYLPQTVHGFLNLCLKIIESILLYREFFVNFFFGVNEYVICFMCTIFYVIFLFFIIHIYILWIHTKDIFYIHNVEDCISFFCKSFINIMIRMPQQSHHTFRDNFGIFILSLLRSCVLWLNNLCNYFSKQMNRKETCGSDEQTMNAKVPKIPR